MIQRSLPTKMILWLLEIFLFPPPVLLGEGIELKPSKSCGNLTKTFHEAPLPLRDWQLCPWQKWAKNCRKKAANQAMATAIPHAIWQLLIPGLISIKDHRLWSRSSAFHQCWDYVGSVSFDLRCCQTWCSSRSVVSICVPAVWNPRWPDSSFFCHQNPKKEKKKRKHKIREKQ